MVAFSISGCGERSGRPEITLTPQDSLLAEALATLQLAEARAEILAQDGHTSLPRAYADATAATGLDSLAIVHAFDELAADPNRAGAILALTADRLQLEQRGLLP